MPTFDALAHEVRLRATILWLRFELGFCRLLARIVGRDDD